MKAKYTPIDIQELSQMLTEAKQHYLAYCKKNAEYKTSAGGQADSFDIHNSLYKEAIDHLKISTGIFDEAMRRVARDYSEQKYMLLYDYYRYVRIETAWGTRLWMNVLYNIMGFPKTFWLMRHFNCLL